MFGFNFRISVLILGLLLSGVGCLGSPGGSHNSGDFIDSDGDGVSDADEIAAGMDPNNPDSDGDGWLDGYDSDSPMIAAALAEKLDRIGRIFSMSFPYGGNQQFITGLSTGDGNNGPTVVSPMGIPLKKYQRSGSVPKGNSGIYGLSSTECEWTSIQREPLNSFFRFEPVGEVGKRSFVTKVVATPLCQDGTPAPGSPFSWTLSSQEVSVEFGRSLQTPRKILQLLEADSDHMEFESAMGNFIQWQGGAPKYTHYSGVHARVEFSQKQAVKGEEISWVVRSAIGEGAEEELIDAGFFGFSDGYKRKASVVLVNPRYACRHEPEERAFELMVFQIDPEFDGESLPAVMLRPRFPMVSGNSVTVCATPFLDAYKTRGQSYWRSTGWRYFHYSDPEVGTLFDTHFTLSEPILYFRDGSDGQTFFTDPNQVLDMDNYFDIPSDGPPA